MLSKAALVAASTGAKDVACRATLFGMRACLSDELKLRINIMEASLSQNELKVHLQNELSKRFRKNPRYSLRSFARYLELDPSSVSQMLSGKRKASPKMIGKICGKIGWPQREVTEGGNYHLLGEDTFAAISDWYHYAILDLTLMEGFRADSRWIARHLGITTAEARNAVERLKRLGMLKETRGRLVSAQAHYVNYVDGQTSEAHKEYQRQILTKALNAIDHCQQEEKDITAITIAADSKTLAFAREKIKQFRRDLCSYMENGKCDSVYVMSIQLFPLAKKKLTLRRNS